jgi:hypothetical protein
MDEVKVQHLFSVLFLVWNFAFLIAAAKVGDSRLNVKLFLSKKFQIFTNRTLVSFSAPVMLTV